MICIPVSLSLLLPIRKHTYMFTVFAGQERGRRRTTSENTGRRNGKEEGSHAGAAPPKGYEEIGETHSFTDVQRQSTL